jgi:tetratricopeptide (TPR) repeat protein/predicted Ser/Thr protein kinase
VVRCPTEHELEQFLDGSCAPDAGEMIDRHRVECPTCSAWLEAASAEDELLTPVRAVFKRRAGFEPAGAEQLPRIARYRVLRRLGAGGMGVVWEAEQQSPVRRVALKLMRPQLVSPRALRRFEHEAQVLARLDHPGIARIWEADTIEAHGERQPFFAMELVDGEPLTRFADGRGLGLRARVDLIARICDAVQHAHQMGVVHRDLKPGNILVTDAGQPKVLDFGVARSLDSTNTAGTLQSEAGQIVGTLPYMSPEQVLGVPGAVDTRSDVYALGVMLYQLLAGRLPLEVGDMGVGEAVRAIGEREPAQLGSLDAALRGDLEAIAAKALEKDRERRYPSAAALAEDLRRWLNSEPVGARAPSALYQLSKLARRNRVAAALVGLALFMLVGGISATTWQWLRAGRAEQAERERGEQLDAQIKRLGVVNAFYKGLLDTGNINKASNPVEFTVRQALEEAARRLESSPPDDVVIEAELRVTLGEALSSIGRAEDSLPHLRRAAELQEHTFGRESRQYAAAVNTLGVSLYALNRTEEAQARFVEALEIYDLLIEEDAEWLEPRQAATLSNLGMVHVSRNELDLAEPILRAALEIHVRTLGEDSEVVARDLTFLASLLSREGRHAEALEMQRRAVDVNARLDEPGGLLAMNAAFVLGLMLADDGQVRAAEESLLEALDVVEKVLGPGHFYRVEALIRLSSVRLTGGDLTGSLEYAREALRVCEDLDSPEVVYAEALEAVARALEAAGETTEAAEVRAEAASERARR